MSIKKILFKNTIFNLTGYVYLLVASFISITFLLNGLGRDLFGVYIFLGTFVSIASIFDFGVSQALIRELSQPNVSKESMSKSWQTAFALFVIQAAALLATFTSLLIFLSFKMPLLQNVDKLVLYPSILVLGITIFVNHLNNLLLSVPQAFQRFDIYNSKTLLVGTANTLISALLVHYTQNLYYIFLLQLVFHLITFLYIWRYVHGFFSGKTVFPKYNSESSKSMLSFGIKNFIGTLAGQMEAQVSKFFLGFLSSAESITAFSIPNNIVSKAAGVVSQFAQAFFPLSTSLLEKDRIKKLKKLYVGFQFLILISGVAAVFVTFYFGESFLTWWLKDSVVVSLAFPVLQILSFYFVLVSLTPLPTALVQSLGKPQVSSFFAVLSICLEIICLSVLVPKYSALGAAYSFLISSAISIPPFLVFSALLLNKKINEYK